MAGRTNGVLTSIVCRPDPDSNDGPDNLEGEEDYASDSSEDDRPPKNTGNYNFPDILT